MKLHRFMLLVGALFTVPAPQRLSAQTDVAALAASVAAAWARHDFASVVGDGRVELRIAGVSAAGPLPPDQARALLAAYVRDAEEVAVTVVTATDVAGGSGYAELRRRYRRRGVNDPVEESILLGFARGAGANGVWRVTVVEIAGARRDR